MLTTFRVAVRSAAALSFAVLTAAATPAFAAAPNGTAVAATLTADSALTPGIGSLEEVVERAIAAPAAAEAAADNAAAPGFSTAITPVLPAPAPAAVERNRPLAELVAESTTLDARDEQAECLASAIYWESKGEPLAGQLAVAEVIINRAASGRFAPTLCGVITQRSQFSFVRGGRIPAPPRTAAAWRTAVAVAHIALDDKADSPVSTALFFHANYVSPGWRLRRLASVGNHIFYR
ncbi:MAG TPA: cell wall hydrolase [Allosphingosinicella sp.]|jgi:spore germination cell wall hydrolase CwlJ-like protein|nr:cell wall hydrolase [Allosphingosinicella sp.]